MRSQQEDKENQERETPGISTLLLFRIPKSIHRVQIGAHTCPAPLRSKRNPAFSLASLSQCPWSAAEWDGGGRLRKSLECNPGDLLGHGERLVLP